MQSLKSLVVMDSKLSSESSNVDFVNKKTLSGTVFNFVPTCLMFVECLFIESVYYLYIYEMSILHNKKNLS